MKQKKKLHKATFDCLREKKEAEIIMSSAERYARYCQAVAKNQFDHPDYRLGQAYFNTLYYDNFDPEFANEIRGTDLDPFHNDDRIDAMVTALLERWTLEENN